MGSASEEAFGAAHCGEGPGLGCGLTKDEAGLLSCWSAVRKSCHHPGSENYHGPSSCPGMSRCCTAGRLSDSLVPGKYACCPGKSETRMTC